MANPTAHPSSPSLDIGDARTYLHLPCVIGDDEAQQDDSGEAYKAFQGQGEHGVLQSESRKGIKGYTAVGLHTLKKILPPNTCNPHHQQHFCCFSFPPKQLDTLVRAPSVPSASLVSPAPRAHSSKLF